MNWSPLRVAALSGLLLLGSAQAGVSADAPAAGREIHQHGPRGMMDRLTDEQKEAMKKVWDEFHDKTFPLRQDIFTKRAELNAVMAQANPDLAKAKALNKEINDLETRIGDQMLEARARISKETGLRGGMMGMRGGMRGMPGGMGGGMGGGMHGMGGGMGCPMMGEPGEPVPPPPPAQ